MSRKIDLKPQHYKIVSGILHEHFPGREVLVFGSRATGKTKKASDLDLCIMGTTPLSLSERGRLADAFDESSLPFKVDFVDWMTLEKWFQDIIREDGVEFDGAGGS